VRRGLINPGKRQISVPGGGSTLTHHQLSTINREIILLMAQSTNFRKPFFVMLLLALVLFEAAIFEGFLPYEWQHAIRQQSERVLPSKRYEPHPDMGWEFELDFRQHPSHRAVFYGVSAILAIGNAYLIAKVWKALSGSPARIPSG
jgi:hypothetical protein